MRPPTNPFPTPEAQVKHSSERILTTHVGSLVRPPELIDLVRAGAESDPSSADLIATATAEVVKRQATAGVDVVSDGEYGKPNFAGYISNRLTGFESRPPDPSRSAIGNWGRDRQAFREFYEQDTSAQAGGGGGAPMVCAGPITYVGQAAGQKDIANFKAALAGVSVEEAFIPAVAPGTIEGQRENDYYSNVEDYLDGIADAMHEEYKAIIDAGFILQIDDPRIVVHYDLINPEPTPDEFRKIAALRMEAVNRAIGDLPPDRIRYHLCWGSWHGPHSTDFPLKEIIGTVLQVRAGAYSIEAANPRHEHEFQIWENVKLPDGKMLIPGVVTHITNTVEHPELVAWRIMNFARLVGRENVMASTDCGFSQGATNPRVHSSIMWAKLQSLAEGARLATEQLWK
jgi:5-methyltetrahydropteroyltriglutamate--homocysteine methyltransferase